ncbi:monodehydroascorbate reductase, partial [Tanacetum coccineum]
TSGSAQFLGDKLVSWSSKKQTSTSISSTEAEYIAMSRRCAQILWMSTCLWHSHRTDEQILPRIRWVPIGKSNCYLDAEKSQSNPIYKIAVDILKHTNFFRAFTASSTIPAIYIQQFWDTICYDRTDGGYKCQLDEQWFNLTKDTLRDALQITPVNNNKAFSSPPTQDTLQLCQATSGFERPRAPVLQILWGVINRAHIDYAERMWEEFTQSIHTFTEDKKNLAQHTQGKKKATLIVLQVSAKGTKREVFGMPIPNELITDDIRGADYYDAYLEKVAKHQRYLAGEEVSDPDSPTQTAKINKPKVTRAKTRRPKAATKNTSTSTKTKLRRETKEGLRKPLMKHRNQTETKAGGVKKRTLKSSQQLVDEFVDEGIPLTERGFSDLEADTQRAIKESLKDAHGAHRGPLPPVVFRETDTGKFQPLPEVEGKGKEKVSTEQAARVLLNLQTPKKKSPTEQYIFQRRTSAPTEPSGHDESSSLYAELGLTESDTESDEEVPPVVKNSAPNEGQAGPNPDAEAIDVTSQPQPGQMDEEFTATAYPNVQENLKLTVDDPVIPEEPASSTGTLSSLQHLAKDFSFGDQFFNDKPPKANNEKTTADTEAESMVSITIHQDTSAIPPMTSPVIDLSFLFPVLYPILPTVHRLYRHTTTATATTTTTIMTTIPLPPQPQQVSSDSILLNRLGELYKHIADWLDANKPWWKIRQTWVQTVQKFFTPIWDPKSYQSEIHDVVRGSSVVYGRDNRDHLCLDLAEARKRRKRDMAHLHITICSPPHTSPPPPPQGIRVLTGALALVGRLYHTPLHLIQQSGGQSSSFVAPTLFTRPVASANRLQDDHAYSSSGDELVRVHITTVYLRLSCGMPYH